MSELINVVDYLDTVDPNGCSSTWQSTWFGVVKSRRHCGIVKLSRDATRKHSLEFSACFPLPGSNHQTSNREKTTCLKKLKKISVWHEFNACWLLVNNSASADILVTCPMHIVSSSHCLKEFNTKAFTTKETQLKLYHRNLETTTRQAVRAKCQPIWNTVKEKTSQLFSIIWFLCHLGNYWMNLA